MNDYGVIITKYIMQFKQMLLLLVAIVFIGCSAGQRVRQHAEQSKQDEINFQHDMMYAERFQGPGRNHANLEAKPITLLKF